MGAQEAPFVLKGFREFSRSRLFIVLRCSRGVKGLPDGRFRCEVVDRLVSGPSRLGQPILFRITGHTQETLQLAKQKDSLVQEHCVTSYVQLH